MPVSVVLRNREVTRAGSVRRDARVAIFALCALIAMAFILGGSSRDDVQSLIILRPLSALFVALGLATIGREDLRRHRGAFAIFGLLIFVNVLQLLPLPAAIWTALPGREFLVQTTAVADLEEGWRPLSLVPFRTWNSLFALMVPLAGLLLAAQCDRTSDLRPVLMLLVGLACISAILGVLQTLAPAGSALFFYQITNTGLAVGLFANRNHNAVFMASAIPAVAFLLYQEWKGNPGWTPRTAILFVPLVILPPAILITGSRSGLFMLLVGALSAPLFVGARALRSVLSGKAFWIPLITVAVLLLFIAAMFPVSTLRRMMEADFVDLRLRIWPIVWQLWLQYFPAGTGFGTLPEVYWIAEPDSQISPKYVNHAHNDVLEILLEGGLAGAVLLLAAAALWIREFVASFRKSGEELMRARLGLLLTAMLALASVFDYPLRTPSLALALVIATVLAKPYRRPEVRGAAAAD